MIDKSWLFIGAISGLISGLIEAFFFGLWFKSVRSGLWILLGASVGTMTISAIFVLKPTFLFQLGFQFVGGKDVFGTSMLGSISILTIGMSLGSILGGLISVSIWLKIHAN